MPDPTEDDDLLSDDEEAQGFLFVAGGESCPICASLDGTYFSDEPARPHASCDCDIIRLDQVDANGKPCGMESWRIEEGDYERYGPLHKNLIVHLTVVVVCAGGKEFTQEVDVDVADAETRIEDAGVFFDYMDARMFDESSDVADALAAAHCAPCESDFRCV